MNEYKSERFTGERALFASRDITITDSVFEAGESPLKESYGIDIFNSIFGWKYPLWYCRDVRVRNSTLLEGARSGIWYTHGISIENSVIQAPKTFRRSTGITLSNVQLLHAAETLWNCRDIYLSCVSAAGDYFAMNSENIVCENFVIDGNYAFDGAKNVTVKNSKLISKDAFWNTENVTVENSVIIGEYLGWNSNNVTFKNCTIQSLQGLCYIGNLKLVDCKLLNTTLAFEYSSADATVIGSIDSVKNPLPESRIIADSFGEIVLDEAFTEPDKIKIITKDEL